jgi:hypothetical protein
MAFDLELTSDIQDAIVAVIRERGDIVHMAEVAEALLSVLVALANQVPLDEREARSLAQHAARRIIRGTQREEPLN